MAVKGGKTRTRTIPRESLKVKKTISLDVEMASRLGSFAGHCRVTESRVVAEALESHLKGFRSFRRGEPGDPGAARGSDDGPAPDHA